MGKLRDKLYKITNELGVNANVESFDDIIELNRQPKSKKRVYVKDDFKIKRGKVSLVPLADIHLGNKSCDIDKLKSFIDYIGREEECYTILLGDIAENATKTSVGLGMYEEDMHLREQLVLLRRLLQPLADKGKILGIHTGNHEFRSTILTGISPMEILSSQLDVPYLEYQGHYVLKVGKQKYKLMSSHGIGSGRTTGAKINAAERLAEINPMCHLYISGHTHIKHAHEKVKYYIGEDDQLKSLKQYYAVCGSFLEYFGGYPEMQLLPPSSMGAVKIDLYADHHDIQISL